MLVNLKDKEIMSIFFGLDDKLIAKIFKKKNHK